MSRPYDIPIKIILTMEVTVEADSLEEAQVMAESFEIDEQIVPLCAPGIGQEWCEFDQQTTEIQQ